MPHSASVTAMMHSGGDDLQHPAHDEEVQTHWSDAHSIPGAQYPPPQGTLGAVSGRASGRASGRGATSHLRAEPSANATSFAMRSRR